MTAEHRAHIIQEKPKATIEVCVYVYMYVLCCLFMLLVHIEVQISVCISEYCGSKLCGMYLHLLSQYATLINVETKPGRIMCAGLADLFHLQFIVALAFFFSFSLSL